MGPRVRCGEPGRRASFAELREAAVRERGRVLKCSHLPAAAFRDAVHSA
jgi:hypothetical protein